MTKNIDFKWFYGCCSFGTHSTEEWIQSRSLRPLVILNWVNQNCVFSRFPFKNKTPSGGNTTGDVIKLIKFQGHVG